MILDAAGATSGASAQVLQAAGRLSQETDVLKQVMGGFLRKVTAA